MDIYEARKEIKALIRYLKDDIEAREDACGKDDVMIVLPAKIALKKAKKINKFLKLLEMPFLDLTL